MVDNDAAMIPMRWVGPMRISGNAVEGDVEVPLATFESPLWPSVARGARISARCPRGITVTVIGESMTRSILLIADDGEGAANAARRVLDDMPRLCAEVAESSGFTELIDIDPQIAGNLLFLRFEFRTGDAAGHNMATAAAERLMSHILTHVPGVRYGSISGNYCTDKKATVVNGIRGRGKNVVADIRIPADIVERDLRSTAERIAELNVRKNLIGTTLAGGIRSANAHYANMLLAVYLATGQDAANIVEGSQGITHAEDRGGDLYFSCSLPNLIVGTVGNGKHLDFATANLARMGCRAERETGANARRLAAIVGATVLCGELSLMAAQTNPGELMRTHMKWERQAVGG